MRLTGRDVTLIKDLALSHVLSRDQIIELDYFSSITRANTRIRDLRSLGLVKRIGTPFYSQSLYGIGPKAIPILGDRIGRIVSSRSDSPRFLQHALSVTNLRIELTRRGADQWKFEQQLRATFQHGTATYEVRPDGLVVKEGRALALEVDLGHVAPAKFAEKLKAFVAFTRSGSSMSLWGYPDFSILVVTTGKLRASRLTRLAATYRDVAFECRTFESLGIPSVGGWS